VPHIPGLDTVHYETSDTIMRVDEMPERLIVLGAGFIAAEMAHVFDAYGACVTILSRGHALLRVEDTEVSRRVTERFAERFDLRLDTTPLRVSADGDGIAVEVESPSGRDVVHGDMLLLATGRFPNGGQLNVAATGVSLDADGYVITDATMATGVDGIWALGDIRNHMQLKHMANLDARIVRHNLLHPDDPRSIDERVVPHVVFTSPQVASVGLTEHQAEMHGRPFVTTVREYGSVAYGWAMEDTTSCAKLLADVETRHLIGAHIVGPQSSLLLQQLVQGMRFELTVDQMAEDVIYPHPALSEVVENALLDLVQQLGR
jgi:mycothione reductase